MLVVLIHGAYTRAWHWHRLVPLLEQAGCEVVAPDLPCDDPGAGIEEYVAVVEAEVGGTDDPPLVVGSSIGAATACAFAARRTVSALVTVAGVIPAPGGSIAADSGAMMQPEFAAAIDRNPDGSTTFRPQAAIDLVFHESDPALARDAASRLRPQAARPLIDAAPFEALPDAPRLGIVPATDRLVRPEWMANAVRDRLGVEPTMLQGDHAPMLSQPDRLAPLILSAGDPPDGVR